MSPFLWEVADVGFTWDRPYQVDATRFTRRFWSNVTPFEIGALAAARSFASTGLAPIPEPLRPEARFSPACADRSC